MDERSLRRFKRNIIVLPTECWFWAFGTVSDDGYGMFSVDGQGTTAHRVSYKHFVGEIPDGFQIDHLCHTWEPWCTGGPGDHHRRCVYWRHLQPVPPPINAQRGVGGRWYCKRRSHEFTPENTYIRPDGGRECKACRREHSVEWMSIHNPGVRHGTETHCPKGHAYEGDNIKITVTGGRACRKCQRQWNRRYQRARRALERGYLPLLPGTAICPVGHDLTIEDNFFAHEGQLVCLICMTPDGSRSQKGAKVLIAAANSALSLSGSLF